MNRKKPKNSVIVIRSQNGCVKSKSCQTIPTSFLKLGINFLKLPLKQTPPPPN